MVKILLLLFMVSLTACSVVAPTNPITKITNIHIIEVGSDVSDEICQGFSLSTAGIEQFFAQATMITFKQLHDEYDYLPCFVKGKLQRNQQACDFTIRAGATAELNCSEHTQYFYACTTCDPLFIAQ